MVSLKDWSVCVKISNKKIIKKIQLKLYNFSQKTSFLVFHIKYICQFKTTQNFTHLLYPFSNIRYSAKKLFWANITSYFICKHTHSHHLYNKFTVQFLHESSLDDGLHLPRRCIVEFDFERALSTDSHIVTAKSHPHKHPSLKRAQFRMAKPTY